jgi:Tfp pilus assembly protein PilF
MNRLAGLLELHVKNPTDSFVMYGIALEYISKKDYPKAEEYCLKLLETDSKYVPVYMQYAQLKEKINQIDEAKRLYLEGIEVANEIGDKHAAKEMEEFLDELE